MSKASVKLSNGVEIAYIERSGEGEPLLLLHGITDNADTYAPLLADIAPERPIYAMDFRGHGASSRSDDRYETAAYADDVCRFIDEVIGAPVHLAGHSLGGFVAAYVAAQAPQRIVTALLEDPPLYFVGNLNATYQALFENMVLMARSLQDGSRSAQDWFEVMAAAPDPYSGRPGIETMGEAVLRERIASIGAMHPQALQDALDQSLVLDVDDTLRSIRCPVTMITGAEALGAVITAEESARVAELVPHCTVVHVPEVGHLIHMQAPQAWLAALNERVARAA